MKKRSSDVCESGRYQEGTRDNEGKIRVDCWRYMRVLTILCNEIELLKLNV